MIRFITPSEVITIALTNSTTNDVSLVNDIIIEATQLRWIKPMLGNDLFDTLEAEFDAGGFVGDNLDLANRLKNPLAFFVKHEITPEMSINQTAAGLQVITTEFSAPATNAQRGEIQDQSLIHAKALLLEVTRFIEKDENIIKFPDYKIETNIQNNVDRQGGIIF